MGRHLKKRLRHKEKSTDFLSVLSDRAMELSGSDLQAVVEEVEQFIERELNNAREAKSKLNDFVSTGTTNNSTGTTRTK